jgi:hypothetical protein
MNLDETIEACDKLRLQLEGVGLSDALIEIITFAYIQATKHALEED